MESTHATPVVSEQSATATSPSLSSLQHCDVTDWSICCICQVKTPQKALRTPNKGHITYAALSERLTKLDTYNALPQTLKSLNRLDDGDGIAQTMDKQNAMWHKSCFDMCNDQKVDRAEKRRFHSDDIPMKSTTRKKLRTSFDNCVKSPCCFFCNKSDGKLRKVETLEIDAKVRHRATEMMDTDILAKLSEGDMAARDSVYHGTCLCAFYNKYNRHYNTSNNSAMTSNNDQESKNAIAFAELIQYIESYEDANEPKVFNMSNLCKLYTNRLLELGINVDNRVHTTHLKDKIIAAIPSLQGYKSGNNVVLSYNTVTGKTLFDASKTHEGNDMITIMRAANIIRKGIFDATYTFQGSLIDPSYSNLPVSLLTLVDMILTGRDISHETVGDENVSEAVSSITQLLIFNAVKRHRKDAYHTRHNIDRETMLPLYLGLMIHGKTRKRELVDILHDKGLSVSYHRVQEVSTDIANTVLEEYERTGIVCPPNLKDGLYTTGNLDNIDHNPQSITSNDAFHGTAISLTQHVFEDSEQTESTCLNVRSSQDKTVTKSLPEKYKDVPPAALKTTTPQPTVIYGCEPPPSPEGEPGPVTLQSEWLQHVTNNIDNPTIDKRDFLSWSAFFAQKQSQIPRPPAITALFPLFRDSAHTAAMVKHGMAIIRDATQMKNPGQVPVLTVDQPLYALAKKIQWLWPDEYGEGMYVVLMGGLHIEMALLKTIGDWLEGSGWISALTTANIITSGRAEHVQKGSNIIRGQWIHQVMVCALYILLRCGYTSYSDDRVDEEDPPLSYEEWIKQSARDYPQFDYWNKTIQLQLLLLKFLQSQREANFDMYKESIRKILPWFFALDHVHYARWLSIHLQDLERLNIASPSTHREFYKGAFVTQKSTHRFSTIAHDQVHEQLNAVIKGDGGFIGITESPETLKRWEVACPELTRILSEVNIKPTNGNGNHHDETRSTQKRFATQVSVLVDVLDELGNPFTDKSNELLTLDTKVIMSAESVESIREAEDKGKKQYNDFMSQNVGHDEKSFYDPLTRNNLAIFRNKGNRKSSKNKDKIKTMKTDIDLFSRMYIACQHRDGDLDNFFAHENHSWPPALAENNELRIGNKSDLMEPLEKMCENASEMPSVDCIIVDGAAVCQSIDPHRANEVIKTFEDYATKAFLPYIKKHLRSVPRIDIIFDTYTEDSLKSYARRNRGTGDPVKVTPSTRIPPNWKTFLRNDRNKTELYQYLSKMVESCEFMPGKTVLSTHGVAVLKSIGDSEIDVADIQPCNHEEADYRMFLHAAHAFNNGSKSVLIHATDTDVVVLAIAIASLFTACSLWLAFGHAKNFRYIPAHMISERLGPETSWGLLLFHAMSGCDTVSAFSGVGKKTAFNTWKAMPELHARFKHLSSAPEQVTDEDITVIERFVILMFSRTSQFNTVNAARKHMFSYGNRQIDKVPPSHSALVQHVLRAVYQSGHIWGQMLLRSPVLPSPSEWGWTKVSGNWCPLWSTLPEASKGCQELIKCNCKTLCRGRCKCSKANLPCTQLCLCSGQCERENDS